MIIGEFASERRSTCIAGSDLVLQRQRALQESHGFCNACFFADECQRHQCEHHVDWFNAVRFFEACESPSKKRLGGGCIVLPGHSNILPII